MSSIARWSYKNTARVRPFLDENLETGEIEYGPEFEIACTWAAEAKQFRNPASLNGEEFVSAYIIWSEDARPKHRDLILLNTEQPVDWQEVRSHMEWDASMFDDTPDYRTVT